MYKTIQSISHKCYKNKVTIIFLFDKSDTKLCLTLHRSYINTKKLSIDDTVYDIAEQISIDIHRDFWFMSSITTWQQLRNAIIDAIEFYI